MAKSKYYNTTTSQWEVVGTDASKVDILDSTGKFTSTDVEGALTELAGKIVRGTATIPTTGWTTHTGDSVYKCNIAIANVISSDWVDVVIDLEYQDTAQAAEINPTTIEYDGGITVYANTVPAVAIPIKFKVVK